MESSSLPSMIPAERGPNQVYINQINMYLPSLQKKMNVAEVTAHLAQAGLLQLHEIAEIVSMAERSRKSAVIHLVKKLTKSKDPNWFSKFKAALKDSGQQIIYKLLNDDEDVRNEEGFERILLQNFPYLTQMIKPIQLLPELYQRETITKLDMEEIASKTKNEGDSNGALKLLTTIPCRKNGWFTDFVAALKKENYRSVLNMFGPNFFDAKSDESIDYHAIKCLERTRQAATPSEQPKMIKPTETIKPMKSRGVAAAELKDASVHDDMLSRSRSTNSFDLPRPKATEAVSNIEIHSNESSPYIVNLVEDDALNPSSLCEVHNQSTPNPVPFSLERKSPAGSSAPRGTRAPDSRGGDFASASNAGSLSGVAAASGLRPDLDLRTDSSLPGQPASGSASGPTNQLSPTSSRGQSSNTSLSSSGTMFGSGRSNGADWPIDDSPVTKQPLKLRGYQMELAKRAIAGTNCIIVAPSGSGKTHVALYISERHLDRFGGDRKVLFLVPKVALVLPQRRQYLTYMNRDCRVASVFGERDVQTTLRDMVTNNDVIVTTPQVLVSAIDEGVMDDSFSPFTLMIFDECHHATKDHPFNQIMSRYNDILLSGDQERIRHLPQVVGLTSSPGVGKAMNVEAATDHILKLCSNMASSTICTITQGVHLEEMRKHAKVAVEGFADVRGRARDPFAAAILKIMTAIEEKMRNRKDLQSVVTEAPNIVKVLAPPAKRDHDSYARFLALLKREIAKIYSQEIRQFFLLCQKHLEVYNNALLINADCRTIEAVEYIRINFNQMNAGQCSSLPSNQEDAWLNRLYTSKAMDFEEMSRSKHAENPKLRYMEDLILGFYKENPNSQGIIFCKMHFMTEAMVKWIEQTESLTMLKPYNLGDAGSTVARGSVSLTHRKLDDVLKYFKSVAHKIIVATSAAEEGLDVKSCNYVIHYEHVTNDIARIQSRGRSCADAAKSVLTVERGNGARNRETTNREELISRSIYLVYQLPIEEFESKTSLHRQTAKRDREMAPAASKSTSASRRRDDDTRLCCFECESMGVWFSDLRTIKGTHHVVLDPEFKDRIVTEEHPRPKRYGEIERKGKIRCKGCDHDWGISAWYEGCLIYLLNVCSFEVEDQDHNRRSYKKWKEVPIKVNELTSEELRSLASVFFGS